LSSELFELIDEQRSQLVRAVVERLHGSTSRHYQQLPVDRLQQRAERLVESFLEALDDRPGVFVEYMATITRERISEGFFLKEIQAALGILEDQAWRLVTERLQAEAHASALARVSMTVGAAKDRLARIYLEQARAAEKRVTLLQEQLDALNAGTEGPPLYDTDDAPDR
jgi:exonuclease VII large subunit